MVVGAGDLLQELLQVDDAEVVGAVRAQAHDAEIRVAHHHRIGRAPLVAGEHARDDVVDVGLERAFERVFPALEVGEDRDVVGRQRVLAGTERVAELAEVDELRDLRFAHDELRAVLDFLVLVGEAERQRVARVVRPLDDVDELFLEEIDDRHRVSMLLVVRAVRGGGAIVLFLRGGEPRGLRLRPCAISASSRCAGSAPGTTDPSAKTSVGVAVTLSFCPSTLVATTGLSQSPLLSGSAPEAKNSSHAFTLSGAHQIILRLARGIRVQLVDRIEESVDRHVVDALELVLEPRAERAVGVGEDRELALRRCP